MWFLSKLGIAQHLAQDYGQKFSAWVAKHQGWSGVIATHKTQIGGAFLALCGWVGGGCETIAMFGLTIDPLHFVDHYFHWNLQCEWFVAPLLVTGAFLLGGGVLSSDERKEYELGLKTPPPK